MCNGAEISLTEGFGEIQYHEQLIKNYTEIIPQEAEAGYKNLIFFSANRIGMDDETGWTHCQICLEKIITLEKKTVMIIQMKHLNSRVNNKDY